jgi:hypothetical protein
MVEQADRCKRIMLAHPPDVTLCRGKSALAEAVCYNRLDPAISLNLYLGCEAELHCYSIQEYDNLYK